MATRKRATAAPPPPPPDDDPGADALDALAALDDPDDLGDLIARADDDASVRDVRSLADLTFDDLNANLGNERGRELLARSLDQYGAGRSILVDKNGKIIAGNKTVEGATVLGLDELVVVRTRGDKLVVVQREDLDLDQDVAARELALADNRVAELDLTWDPEVLERLGAQGVDLDLFWDPDELLELLGPGDAMHEGSEAVTDGPRPALNGPSLADRFLVPPFSVLDTRQGRWTERKRRWLALGLKSEQGRDEMLTYGRSAQAPGIYAMRNQMRAILGRDPSWDEISAEAKRRGIAMHTGTSVFDPVLTEIAYRWFSPPGGAVLDPFAGGSVRGVVASATGRQYFGVELRGEQVDANRAQWIELAPRLAQSDMARAQQAPAPEEDFMPDLTPVESRDGYWFKRDDRFCVAGVRGGKVRTCWELSQGAVGLVTAGSRASPQVNIVAHIAARLGIPCRVHTPTGALSPEVQEAQRCGAEVIQHPAGYNNVIIARAREDAQERGWTEIPFDMECALAVAKNRQQAANLPREAKRLVVPVGSGMSLSGILHGLRDHGIDMPVLGVQVGADPTKRLDEYAPANWREMVTLVTSAQDYHDAAPVTQCCGLALDPHYEAKCLPFLEPGDCLWMVGIRQTATEIFRGETAAEKMPPTPAWIHADSRTIDTLDALPGDGVDLVFSCPPYADLEVYSDDPQDLSTLKYPEFVAAYREIIAKACARLKDNRFAVFVVGEVRDPKTGHYRNFVGDTIQAFEDAGLHYYNEMILITPYGSLAIRVGNQMTRSRKVGKTHQTVLVFVKGDAFQAAEACGPFTIDQEAIADELREDDPDAELYEFSGSWETNNAPEDV